MTDILTVSRYNLKPDWTISKLLLYDKHDGYAVEDEIRTVKVKGETAIPYGRYLLSTRVSPKFTSFFLYSKSTNKLIEAKDKDLHKDTTDWMQHELIWITGVPNFEFVLLHWGNTDDSTDGCLIVGSGLGVIDGQEGVINSRNYYKQLYPKLYTLVKSGGQYINYIKESVVA